MKKFFLLFLILSSGVFAQSTVLPSNTTQGNLSPFSLENIKTKFKISYFSETLGPSIKKLDDNEVTDSGGQDRQPTSMYHSLATRFLLTKKFNLFVNSSVATTIGSRRDIYANADPNVLVMDDWQFGIWYDFVKNSDVTYSQRLTHRAPFSNKSKNENIDSQVEWQHWVNWKMSSSWRLLYWNTYRYYAFNEYAKKERWRINSRAIFNYTINDKFNLQFNHELDMQHNNTNVKSNRKHRDANFLKPYHHYVSVGFGYSPVRSFTAIPFIRMLDPKNIRNETVIVGMWLLGTVL